MCLHSFIYIADICNVPRSAAFRSPSLLYDIFSS